MGRGFDIAAQQKKGGKGRELKGLTTIHDPRKNGGRSTLRMIWKTKYPILGTCQEGKGG